MRRRYLVCYDVSDPKRLRRVYKTMQGYGDALQYSVFCCELSPRQKVSLDADLSEIINHQEDRVMIVDTGRADSKRPAPFQFLGRSSSVVGRHTVII